MLITTQDELADYEITETLGMVKGNTIRARHVGKDIMAGLRTRDCPFHVIGSMSRFGFCLSNCCMPSKRR